MTYEEVQAKICRDFLRDRDTCHFRLGNTTGMRDAEVIEACRMYCAESGSMGEYEKFRREAEGGYVLCGGEYVERDVSRTE